MKEYSVLIIDDDVWMQRILSKTLASYGFKKAYLANNGFDGIGKSVEFKPDLIVLDILMPELSGHLTLKVMKSIKSIKEIPVFMVSALSDVENLGRAVKSGTAGFISKPFTRDTVYEKLLDLYGKEKLDLIQKGMDIDEKSNLGYFGDNAFGQLSGSYGSSGSDEIEGGSGFKLPDFSQETPSYDSIKDSGFGGDKLSDRYKDDEKKSIDSIKELLMKTRK